MTTFIMGIVVGAFIGIIVASAEIKSFKRILVMKAKDGTAEYIDGKFYYIREEGK